MKKYICIKEHTNKKCEPIIVGHFYYLEYDERENVYIIMGLRSLVNRRPCSVPDSSLNDFFLPVRQFVFGK
jgi:hypothetical protein